MALRKRRFFLQSLEVLVALLFGCTIIILVSSQENFCTDQKNDNEGVCQQDHPLLDNDSEEKTRQEKESSCGLYMAESTIPNAGLGVFTGRTIQEGHVISYPEIVIPAVDVKKNHRLQRWATTTTSAADKDPESSWLLNDYYWNSRYTGTQFEAEHVESIVPGIGMLANGVTGDLAWNARSIRSPRRGDAGLQVQHDPGAGASTSFHGHLFVAANGNIEAGAEILDEYGDSWFWNRRDTIGIHPLSNDYKVADHLLKQYWFIVGGKSHKSSLNDDPYANEVWKLLRTASCEAIQTCQALPKTLRELSTALRQDGATAEPLTMQLWNVIGTDPDSQRSEYTWIMFRTALCQPERVCLALPQELDDVEDALQTGTARYHMHNAKRSIPWLEENGQCLDNIKTGISSIPQAGHGAFATRHIPEGNVIAPAPVVQLHKRHMEIMASSDAENVMNRQAKLWRNGTQLLLNYCFGHENSSILLFPYSPIVAYINHGDDGEHVNAKLQWSTHSYHREEMLHVTVDELMQMPHAGLVMEYVATRDIRPGEEILIDYGKKWRKAWREHVRAWKPSPFHANYSPAWKLNDLELPVRTEKEQEMEPYPPNTLIGCHVGTFDKNNKEKEAIVSDIPMYEWEVPMDNYSTTQEVFKCEILQRSTNNNDAELYKAKVWKFPGTPWIVTNIPRRAIEFFDKPYASELSLRNAFRHEIGLPDHMLSEAWKDR